MRNGDGSVEGDIGEYVATKVPHADPVINSIYRAQNLTQLTDKPILATAQDHITGEIKPLAWFQRTPRGTIEFNSAVPLNLLFANNYDPAIIYAEGIPQLEIGDLPEVFQKRLNNYAIHNTHLKEDFPDLEEIQKVQNPKTIVLSTNIKPLQIGNPHLFGLPGSAFEIRFGRERFDGEDSISSANLRDALNQAHYPIANSVRNHKNDSKDFSKTNRVLIKTSNIDLSLYLACELADKLWMQEWMELPNHRILIAQSRGGETTRAEYLT